MTLGTGVVVAEGAVLVVDSSRTVYREDGSIEEEVVPDKLLLVEPQTDHDLRLAVCHSGPSPVARKPKALPDDGGDFFTASENIWKTLTHVRWADFVAAEHRSSVHEVIIAGGKRGEPTRLLRLGTDVPPREADGRYIFGIGYASGLWEPRRRPATLVEAIASSLEVFTAQMRERISQAARLGVPAGVAWPANVAWISPEKIDTFTLAEPHFQCAF